MTRPSDHYVAEYRKIVDDFWNMLGLPMPETNCVPLPTDNEEATLALLRKYFDDCLELARKGPPNPCAWKLGMSRGIGQ